MIVEQLNEYRFGYRRYACLLFQPSVKLRRQRNLCIKVHIVILVVFVLDLTFIQFTKAFGIQKGNLDAHV